MDEYYKKILSKMTKICTYKEREIFRKFDALISESTY